MKEHLYCANHVVNAVLAEKHTLCEIAGITLDTNVILDENCSVESLHLCSIFSNLLDNALNACCETSGSVITLTTLQKGDYLHIKCTNPIPKDGKSGQKSGYGTRILADITEKYEGVYNVEDHNDTYCAVISLLCLK